MSEAPTVDSAGSASSFPTTTTTQSAWLRRGRIQPTNAEKWCFMRGFHGANLKVDDCNYLRLNGGKAQVPEQSEDEFFATLATDVALGNENFFVQRRGPVYPLFMDIDYDSKTLAIVSDEEFHALYGVILHCMREIYADTSAEARRMIVCSAAPKLRKKDGIDVQKTGKHVVFPDIFVDSTIATSLCRAFSDYAASSQRLQKCPNLSIADLEDLFDKSVYESNGIRMLYNHKATACLPCLKKKKQKTRELQRHHNKQVKEWLDSKGTARPLVEPKPLVVPFFRDESCAACFGRGYVYEGRPYRPTEVFDGDLVPLPDELGRLQANVIYALKQCSVRPPASRAIQATPFSNSERIDKYLDESSGAKAKTIKRHKTAGVAAEASGGGGGGGGWADISSADEAFQALDVFIYKRFRPNAPGMPRLDAEVAEETDAHAISTLRRSPDGNAFIASSISRYCVNKQAEMPKNPSHERSRVYFCVLRKSPQADSNVYVSQRCHSKKVYNGGPCDKFRGPPVALPRNIVDLLWPPPPKTDDDIQNDELLALESEADASAAVSRPAAGVKSVGLGRKRAKTAAAARMTELLLLQLQVKAFRTMSEAAANGEALEDNSIDGHNGEDEEPQERPRGRR